MVVMRPPFWISILFTFIDCVQMEEISVTACSGRPYTCSIFTLNCTLQHIRIIGAEYRYNKKANCASDSCSNINKCCSAENNDCTANYSEYHLQELLRGCDGKNWCGPIQSPPTPTLDHIGRCNEYKWPGFIHLTYTCIPPGTSTTTKEIGTSANISSTIVTSTASLSTSGVTSSNKQSDEDGQSKHLIIILVVVATVLVIPAILAAVVILHRRRCKKPARDDVSKDELPNELINHDFTSNRQSPMNYETVETLNYDEINDESMATYSIPARKEKDDSAIAKDEKKNGGNGSIDEYDRTEFVNKSAVKMPNYDSVSAIEVKKLDDTYSHVSSQSKQASSPTTDEYSHGQFARKDSQSNDCLNKTTLTNEPCVADNYSHVDFDLDRTKRRQSNIVEEDSYNRIDLDKTRSASRNGEAASVRTIPISEECSQTFKEDLQSLDVESEVWPIDNRNSGVSSKDLPLQDIKTVSLPDNYIEFKIGDIYDTPVCKDQQYTVVLKRNNEQLFNRIDARSKQNSATEESNSVTKDFEITSDYELAKPIDF